MHEADLNPKTVVSLKASYIFIHFVFEHGDFEQRYDKMSCSN